MVKFPRDYTCLVYWILVHWILQVHDKKIPAMYCGPVENSHVENYKMALTKFPLSIDRKKWSEAETKNLEKGIQQQFQEMMLQNMVDRLRYLLSFLSLLLDLLWQIIRVKFLLILWSISSDCIFGWDWEESLVNICLKQILSGKNILRILPLQVFFCARYLNLT